MTIERCKEIIVVYEPQNALKHQEQMSLIGKLTTKIIPYMIKKMRHPWLSGKGCWGGFPADMPCIYPSMVLPIHGSTHTCDYSDIRMCRVFLHK